MSTYSTVLGDSRLEMSNVHGTSVATVFTILGSDF